MGDHDYAEKLYTATPMYIAAVSNTKPEFQDCQKIGSEKKHKSNRICCVPECHTTGYSLIEGHGKPSYHAFPDVNDPLRAVWLAKIRRDEDKSFKVRNHTVVCSLHFEKDSVEVSGFAKRSYLKPGAIPTVFECWKNKPHLYKSTTPRPENSLQKRRKITSDGIDVSDSTSELASDHEPVQLSETCSSATECSGALVKQLELQNHFLLEQLQILTKRCESLEKDKAELKNKVGQLSSERDSISFCVENLKSSEFPFYTGFPSREVFYAVLKLVDPGENGENIILVPQKGDNTSETDKQKVRKPRKLSPANQFLLFLCRVRVGLFENDLAKRFNVSLGTVSTTIISWANFLYLRLGSMNIWPTREQVNNAMPSSFKEKYPTTRVIIDCTEIKIEMASSLLLKSQTYSNYKSANTLKGLVGISPSGSITFVSQLYHGNISDREITLRSGFLGLDFEKGDSVMADKGFDIQDLLDNKSVRLNIPPFLGQYDQMTSNEVRMTQSIAAERIHVERAINKIKNFHIFDQIIPVSLFGTINQIWTVCALLTLFQDPIISCPGN